MSRGSVIAFRQHVGHLVRRLPKDELATAARPGLQDSAPRSAVIALRARVRDIEAAAWQAPGLVQVWGPRGAIYLVRERDRGVFTLGLTPRDAAAVDALRRAANRFNTAVRGLRPGSEIPSHAVDATRPGRLAATVTGRVVVRWDASTIALIARDPPAIDVEEARRELARRFLHHLGPGTAGGFARWSGVSVTDARGTFAALGPETVPVTLAGERRVLLADDLPALSRAEPADTVRLLPPGDPYLTTPDRELIVPDERLRAELWPRSVPPGALLVDADVVATWRRRGGTVTVTHHGRVGDGVRDAAQREVAGMPVDGVRKVEWVR